MDTNEITVFQRAIETCADPAEIARKAKLAFKRMPGEMALACFACPKTVAALLERGVDPNHRNNLGLCWNNVKHHVIRLDLQRVRDFCMCRLFRLVVEKFATLSLTTALRWRSPRFCLVAFKQTTSKGEIV